jgi:hypothetical protein
VPVYQGCYPQPAAPGFQRLGEQQRQQLQPLSSASEFCPPIIALRVPPSPSIFIDGRHPMAIYHSSLVLPSKPDLSRVHLTSRSQWPKLWISVSAIMTMLAEYTASQDICCQVSDGVMLCGSLVDPFHIFHDWIVSSISVRLGEVIP